MLKEHRFGPVTAGADAIHALKHRGPYEDFREAANRLANGLSDNSYHYGELREAIGLQQFSPAGRIWSAIGSPKTVTAFNCLSGDTPVLTLEHGVVPIASLAGKKVHVLDGNRDWTLAEFRSHGKQQLRSIRFTNGKKSRVIQATANHRWIMLDGSERVTNELERNDKIAHLTPLKSVTDEYEYLRGIQHGILFGDGTQGREAKRHTYALASVALFGASKELLSFFEGYTVCYPPSLVAKNGCHVTIPSSKAWCDFKAFPIEPTQDYLLGFIRGWVAADGCVGKNGSGTDLSLAGPETSLEWLKVNGPKVGFYVSYFSRLSDWITGSEIVQEGWRKTPTFNIFFDRRSTQREDLLLTKHQDRWVHDDANWWRVAAIIENVGEEEVYCAEVPTTHSFTLGYGMETGNCFVSGTIEDSLLDGNGSIMNRLTQAMTTLRLGGGIGYDFSNLRPRGALIKRLASHSCGPVRFIEMFDAAAGCIASTGERRAAQMGTLRVDHPDVLEFIRCKQRLNYLTCFNLSVLVTDEFMECLAAKRPFKLRFEGQVYQEVDPEMLWEAIMRSTWDWGDPGVLFIDRINRANNLRYCENITATNPCGEQPLPPYGACLLGSINLPKFLTNQGTTRDAYNDRVVRRYGFDWDLFDHVVGVSVRALDNVVDRTHYPLYEQEKEAKSKRRMGLGIMGLANAGEALGHSYGSPEFCAFTDAVLERLQNATYMAGARLAKEKGTFPLFKLEQYQAGEQYAALRPEVQDAINRHGLRNSHYTSIAPTGTIAICADNVSSGLEPVVDYEYDRQVMKADGTPQTFKFTDYGYGQLGVHGKRLKDVTLEDHVKVLQTCAPRIDSSVSKTINVGQKVTYEQFKSIYMDAYESGCKSCTTFRIAGKKAGIFGLNAEEGEEESEQGAACYIDPTTNEKVCSA